MKNLIKKILKEEEYSNEPFIDEIKKELGVQMNDQGTIGKIGAFMDDPTPETIVNLLNYVYNRGYDHGGEQSYTRGYNDGYDDGHNEGYNEGYDSGFGDCPCDSCCE